MNLWASAVQPGGQEHRTKTEAWKLSETSAKLLTKANLSEKQQVLSAEALQDGKAWSDVFQALKQKQKDCRARLMHPAVLASKNGRTNQDFPWEIQTKAICDHEASGTEGTQGTATQGGWRKIPTGLAAQKTMNFTGGTNKQMRGRKERVLTHQSSESLTGQGGQLVQIFFFLLRTRNSSVWTFQDTNRLSGLKERPGFFFCPQKIYSPGKGTHRLKAEMWTMIF